MLTLTRTQARRVCVRASLLSEPRPSGLLNVLRHLTSIQVDLTEAVARHADLVMWSRLGSSYTLGDLDEAFGDGQVIEVGGFLRPAEDYALMRADLDAWPGRGSRRTYRHAWAEWVEANNACRHDILRELRESGPLVAEDLPDTCDVAWTSSGWTNNRNVVRMLDLMEASGQVAVVGRQGKTRLWDLAERAWPDLPALAPDEARRVRNERVLHAFGLLRPRGQSTPWVVDDEGGYPEVGEECAVEGVRGRWRVAPELLEGSFKGRTAILSPLDRLVFDRTRLAEVFEFDYQLEMYKPQAKRRWGYWAMPILHGDRLIGKLDATADRRAGMLFVDAIHRDGEWTDHVAAAVEEEIRSLGRFLGLTVQHAP